MKLKKFNSIDELEKEIDSYFEFAERNYGEVELPPHILKEKQLSETGQLPSSNRSSTAKQKFNSHKNYKDLVNVLNFPKGPDAVKNKIDTWYKDTLYGLIDPKGSLAYHNYWVFVDIGENQSNPICVFDFVADAFDQMIEIFNSKGPRQENTLLGTLQPKRGSCCKSTISIEKKYNEYIDQRYQDFISFAARTGSKTSKTQGYFSKESQTLSNIKNFDDFKKEIVKYFKKEKKIATFNGFFDTNNTNIYDSYLAFDIFDDADNPNDETRIAFLKDPNYFIYEYAARQAGFFVDQNKPWRLVADLSSKAMAAAMVRRLQVARTLFKTKKDVEKAMKVVKSMLADDLGIGRFYENSRIVFSPNYFGEVVTEFASVLRFIDYFRNDLNTNKNSIKSFKDRYATIIIDKAITDKTTLQSVLIKKSRIPDATPRELEILDEFAASFISILASLAENRHLVDFIYKSLESQIKVLAPVDQKFNQITENDLYKAVFAPIHEYTYFTYFPRKIEEFYLRFLESYPSYTTFEKDAKGLTKAVKNPRSGISTDQTRKSSGLINDFYNLDFLIDYIDLRLIEENKQISPEERRFLIDEVKELYQESLRRYEKGQDLFLNIRNIATKIIEGYIGNPYDKDRPIDFKKEKRKAGMYAQQTLFNQSALEPRILLERICLTLPDRADILVEDEVCGKFDFAPAIAEDTSSPTFTAPSYSKTPAPKGSDYGLEGSACFDVNDCQSGFYCKGSKPSAGVQGECATLESLKDEKPTGIFSKVTGKCDATNTIQNLAALFAGTPNSGLIVLVVGGYIKQASENAKTKAQCDNLVPLILELAPEDGKAGLEKSLKGKVIKGEFKDED